MLKQRANVAAIYKRLSRDDGGDAESNSIVTQGQMLRRFAKEHGFIIYDEYTDDGYSGTTFERPDFKRMVRDIEEGKIGIVLCKDLSRLGRNNALVAYYTEIFFPDNDIRFVCVSEGIDTINGENEIMPFKSVINEYYAKDISRKVKSAYRTKSLNGEFTAPFAPYGYMKDPENNNHLIIDDKSAPVVKHIFQMAADGLSPYKISVKLSEDKILTPRAYITQQYGKYKSCYPKYPTDWCNSTIKSILKNQVYIGHMVNNKCTTKSFKNRKLVSLPEKEWIVIENTHEPIVDEYLFEMAQKVVHIKKRENSKGIENIFAGLLKCSDCHSSLGYVKGKSERHQGAYNCNTYRKNGLRYCTAHYINYKVLYQLVLNDIKRNAQTAKIYESELSEYAKRIASKSINSKQKLLQKEYKNLKQRCGDLDAIIKKLFEQNVLGIISDERFISMSRDYEDEQKEIKKRILELENVFKDQENEENNTVKFLNIVRQYSEITELNKAILKDLIESIVIHNAEGSGIKDRKQKIEINYKFIGTVKLNA